MSYYSVYALPFGALHGMGAYFESGADASEGDEVSPAPDALPQHNPVISPWYLQYERWPNASRGPNFTRPSFLELGPGGNFQANVLTRMPDATDPNLSALDPGQVSAPPASSVQSASALPQSSAADDDAMKCWQDCNVKCNAEKGENTPESFACVDECGKDCGKVTRTGTTVNCEDECKASEQGSAAWTQCMRTRMFPPVHKGFFEGFMESPTKVVGSLLAIGIGLWVLSSNARRKEG